MCSGRRRGGERHGREEGAASRPQGRTRRDKPSADPRGRADPAASSARLPPPPDPVFPLKSTEAPGAAPHTSPHSECTRHLGIRRVTQPADVTAEKKADVGWTSWAGRGNVRLQQVQPHQGRDAAQHQRTVHFSMRDTALTGRGSQREENLRFSPINETVPLPQPQGHPGSRVHPPIMSLYRFFVHRMGCMVADGSAAQVGEEVSPGSSVWYGVGQRSPISKCNLGGASWAVVGWSVGRLVGWSVGWSGGSLSLVLKEQRAHSRSWRTVRALIQHSH